MKGAHKGPLLYVRKAETALKHGTSSEKDFLT